MEEVKKTVGAFFGMSPVETDVFIVTLKERILPFITLVSRICFVISFVYCLIVYTAAGIILLILGYYLVQLEQKVEQLERKIKDDYHNY